MLFLCHSLTRVAGSSGHLKAQSCEFVRQLSGLPPMDCRDEMQKVASPAVLFRSQPYTSQSCLSINCDAAIVFLHVESPVAPLVLQGLGCFGQSSELVIIAAFLIKRELTRVVGILRFGRAGRERSTFGAGSWLPGPKAKGDARHPCLNPTASAEKVRCSACSTFSSWQCSTGTCRRSLRCCRLNSQVHRQSNSN